MSTLRRLTLRMVIVAFALAAVMGIAALLIGEFGDTQFKILMTTLAVGFEALAVLCYLAPSRRAFLELGISGLIVSLVCLATALTLTWVPDAGNDIIYRIFFVTLVVAVTIAQACLLGGLVGQPRGVVSWILRFTLLMATIVAVMLIVTILSEGVDATWFWRLFGVAAILDAFGTVSLIAVRLFTGDPNSDRAALDRDTERQLAAAGAAAGVSAQQVLDEAIATHLARLATQPRIEEEPELESSGDDVSDREA